MSRFSNARTLLDDEDEYVGVALRPNPFPRTTAPPAPRPSERAAPPQHPVLGAAVPRSLMRGTPLEANRADDAGRWRWVKRGPGSEWVPAPAHESVRVSPSDYSHHLVHWEHAVPTDDDAASSFLNPEHALTRDELVAIERAREFEALHGPMD